MRNKLIYGALYAALGLLVLGQVLFVVANGWVMSHEIPQAECAEFMRHWPLLDYSTVVLTDGREVECGYGCTGDDLTELIIAETTCDVNRL